MSRETSSKYVNQRTLVTEETRNCDICGRLIDPDEPPDGDEDLYTQELIILLNADLCVNSRVKMDLCRTCLDPIWEKICLAINADPNDELRIGQD